MTTFKQHLSESMGPYNKAMDELSKLFVRGRNQYTIMEIALNNMSRGRDEQDEIDIALRELGRSAGARDVKLAKMLFRKHGLGD